jgi:hypothetical protein
MDAYFADGALPETNHVEVQGTLITPENASDH